MTKKEKKNAVILASVAGAAILLWYLWDKKVGPFAPGGVLAPASSSPGSNAPTTVNTGPITTNTSTVNTGAGSSAAYTAPVTAAPYKHQIFVPLTVATMNGVKRRRMGNIV